MCRIILWILSRIIESICKEGYKVAGKQENTSYFCYTPLNFETNLFSKLITMLSRHTADFSAMSEQLPAIVMDSGYEFSPAGTLFYHCYPLLHVVSLTAPKKVSMD
jgi:hypothetical protein